MEGAGQQEARGSSEPALSGGPIPEGSSRRRWRAVNKPPVRRGDPIFDLASWILPSATIGMFVGSTGSSRGRSVPITEDDAAFLVAACAGVILLTLLAVSIRLLFRRGQAPLSLAGGVTLLVLSALSMTLVLARGNGEVSPTVLVMLAENGLCMLVGAVALWLSVVRRRPPTSSGH